MPMYCISILAESYRAAYLHSQVIKGYDLFHHLAFQSLGFKQHMGALHVHHSDQQSSLAFEEISTKEISVAECPCAKGIA